MVEFFRDTISGKVYGVLVVVCIFLILAAIGYLVTQKLEEKKKKTAAPTPQTEPAQQ